MSRLARALVLSSVSALVACGSHERAPEPASQAPVDHCVEAMQAARAAPANGTNARAVSIAVACADVYRLPACRDVHARAATLPIESFAATLLQTCAQAYCPELAPRPAACGRLAELRVYEMPAAWLEVREAIWRHDRSDAEVDRLLRATPRY